MTIEHPLSDQELWQRAASGVGDAFAEAHRRYADRIYGYCFPGAAPASTAQYLTSVVFLEDRNYWLYRPGPTWISARSRPGSGS